MERLSDGRYTDNICKFKKFPPIKKIISDNLPILINRMRSHQHRAMP